MISFNENVPIIPYGEGMINIQDITGGLCNDLVLLGLLQAIVATFSPDHALIEGWIPIQSKVPREHLVETQDTMAHKLDRMNMDHQDEYKAIFGGSDRALWRLWLKAGVPWPARDVRVFDSWQNQQPDEETDLLNGKLFTWNRFAPWNLPRDDDWHR